MKLTRILAPITLMIVAAFIGWQAYLLFGRGTVTVSASPADASIVVDKKAYTTTTAKNITLSPGEHTVIIALDGFNTIQQTITMGWQDKQTISYQLTPKPFKDIYQNLSPNPSYTNYEAVQPKFFLNNTWAAAYIVDQGESESVSVAVIRRVNGAWQLVVHDHEFTEETQAILPPQVYDHIKEFTE